VTSAASNSPSHRGRTAAAKPVAPGVAPAEREAELYRNLVEQAVDGIFISKDENVIIEVNESGARLLGLAREKLIGRRVADFICEEDRGQYAADWQAVNAGLVITRERKFRRADGSTFAGEVSAKRLSDGQFQGILRDISARKLAEAAVRESEERFRNLTAAAFEGICIHDRGRIVEVNDQFARLFGYERAALIGRDALTLVAPASLPLMTRVIRDGLEGTHEYLILRKDGTVVPAEAQAKTLSWGDREMRVVSVRDLSARQRTELALRASEEKFSKAFGANPNPCLIAESESGRILDVNAAFLRWQDTGRDQIIGRSAMELGLWRNEQDREDFRQALRTGGSLRDFKVHGHTLRGKDFVALLSSEMLDLEGGRAIFTILHDITDREQAEVAVRESEEKFSKAFLVTPLTMAISDLDTGRLIEVNDAFLRNYEATRAKVIGRSRLELGLWPSPIDQEEITATLRAGGSVRNRRIKGRTATGRPVTLLVNCELIHLRQRAAVLTIVQDITETERAEAALRESEEKFSKAFRSAPDAMAIAEFDSGRYLEVNEGFTRLFGYTRHEVIGHTSVELGIWRTTADRELFLARLRASGAVRELEIVSATRSGTPLTYVISAECMMLGGLRCIVSTTHDITDRKRAETDRTHALEREAQARQEFTRRLLAAQEAERRRIAGELHDSLGQNLLLLKNRAQLALDEGDVPATLRWQFESFRDLAGQAIAEVRQISYDLHPYQLDQLGLTRALDGMIAGAVRNTGFPFERRLDDVDDLFPPEAATHLFRIVQEAVNNVLKHARARSARILLERDVHEVHLLVEDDGGGFTPVGGPLPGLGLRNIAERVRIIGGRLQIDSAPGRGTRIDVVIPSVTS
jgi:PAS domain S-box-containing protein